MTQSVKKKGYIDVKIPAKSRNGPIKKWKAWKRRWVVIHGLHDITSGAPIITIDIYPHEQMENQQFERTTIYLNNIKSISRTLSKTHPYAFQVITSECTLFLSGKSETDSQAWILAFRKILWPPVSKMSVEDTIGGVYDAVVIECLSPVTATLKGVIAHLIILPSVVLIGGFETGGILYDWPLKMISNVRLVNVSNVADKGKIVAIETSSEATLSGKFHFFSEKGEELVDALSSCLKECKIDISENKSERQRRISTYHLRRMSSGRSSIRQNQHNERYVQLRKSSEDWTSAPTTMTPSSNEPNSTSQSLLNLHPDSDTASFQPKMEKLIEDDKERHCIDSCLPSVPSNSDSVIVRKSKTNQICASRLSSSMSNLSDVTKKLSDNKCYKESDRGIPSATVRSTGSLYVTEDVAATPKGVVAETVTLRRRQRKTSPKQGQAKQLCTRMSRDSGVGACNADEPSSRDSSAGRGLPPCPYTQTENDLDELPRPASFGDYENFCDDAEEQPWRCCSSSSSEEGTIYSEIDFDNFHVTTKDDTFAKYDPIYEDLELFRKDIHKLLGIPIKAGEKLSKTEDTEVSQEVPPPLPPRKYTNNSQPVDLRRKDVYKFLGVEGNIEATVAQGTRLNRFSSVTIPSSPATINRRRKNICSFLGIPNMPDTCNQQVAAAAEGNQATYDTLIGIVPRKYNPAIPQPHDKSLTYSGSLKSYVRPRTLQRPPALPSPLPIQKRLKKRSGSFLKLLSSSKNKDLNLDDCSATYVRYDWSVPDHLDDFRSTLRKKDSGLGAERPLPEIKQEVLAEMKKSEIPIFECEETPPSPAKPIESKERNTNDDELLTADRLSKHLNRLSDDILRVRAARSCNRELAVFNSREPRSKSADTKAEKSLLKPQEDETPSYENFEVVRETLRREAANLAMQNFPSSNNANNELKVDFEGIIERRGISRPRTDSLYTDMTGPQIHVSRCEDPLQFVPDGKYSRFNLDIDSDYAMIDFELHRAEQQELDEISLLGSPDEVFPLTSIESMVSEQVAAFTKDDFRSSPVSLESVFTCLGELRSLCDLNSTGKSCRKSVLYCGDTDLKLRDNLVFSFGSSDEFNCQVSTICDLDDDKT